MLSNAYLIIIILCYQLKWFRIRIKQDTRTEHQALPVKAGTKYGANAWYHQRDFKTPHSLGCG